VRKRTGGQLICSDFSKRRLSVGRLAPGAPCPSTAGSGAEPANPRVSPCGGLLSLLKRPSQDVARPVEFSLRDLRSLRAENADRKRILLQAIANSRLAPVGRQSPGILIKGYEIATRGGRLRNNLHPDILFNHWFMHCIDLSAVAMAEASA
jgi:hypothetical protein